MEISPVTTAARPRKVQTAKAAEPKSGKASARPPTPAKTKAQAKPKAAIPAKALTKTKVVAKAEKVVSPTSAKRKPAAKTTLTSAADLMQEIARAAYLMAEQRHFAPGHELQDWLAAEKLVRAGSSKAC